MSFSPLRNNDDSITVFQPQKENKNNITAELVKMRCKLINNCLGLCVVSHSAICVITVHGCFETGS